MCIRDRQLAEGVHDGAQNSRAHRAEWVALSVQQGQHDKHAKHTACCAHEKGDKSCGTAPQGRRPTGPAGTGQAPRPGAGAVKGTVFCRPLAVRRVSRHTFAQNCQHSLMEGDCLMKQIILPVTVHLNIRLPLALLQPEPADAPTGPEPEAHACQGCGNCGGCRKCQHEEKQA